jgi:hypothetical protein
LAAILEGEISACLALHMTQCWNCWFFRAESAVTKTELHRLARNFIFSIAIHYIHRRKRLILNHNYKPHKEIKAKKKNKLNAIPVTGCGGLQGCEKLRIPLCLDIRLIDGGKVVGPTHRPHFTPQKHNYFYVSGILFC